MLELDDSKKESKTNPDFYLTMGKNHINLTNTAKAAIRFETNNVVTAALATAVLIDYGTVKKSQVITDKKV